MGWFLGIAGYLLVGVAVAGFMAVDEVETAWHPAEERALIRTLGWPVVLGAIVIVSAVDYCAEFWRGRARS